MPGRDADDTFLRQFSKGIAVFQEFGGDGTRSTYVNNSPFHHFSETGTIIPRDKLFLIDNLNRTVETRNDRNVGATKKNGKG